MKVAIVSNFLGSSGGDFVNIVIAKALESEGHLVDIYTSTFIECQNAFKSFEETIGRNITINEVRTLLPSPYSVYQMVKKVQCSRKYEMVILNDDFPRNIRDNQFAKPIVAYIHFPSAAKIKYDFLVDEKYNSTLSGKLKWKIHKAVFKKAFCLDALSVANPVILANSTLTSTYIKKLWPNSNPKILYPPVQVQKIMDKTKGSVFSKEDQILYLGRILNGKKIEDIIHAATIMKKSNKIVKIKLIGPIVDISYASFLKSLIKKNGLEKSVELTGLIPRDLLIQTLANSKVLVHPCPNEPFGVAVVESMSAGCVPVVKKGLNGPWLDILEGREDHGYGYTSIKELAEKIQTALSEDETKRIDIINYSLRFEEKKFMAEFIHQID